MTTSGSGIVRRARRPAGWHPGGPRPPATLPANAWPRAGEDLCHLSGDFRILQRLGGHRWSLDDLLTAHFAASIFGRSPRRFADLGCGVGSVLMMLAWRFPEARGVGIEAQAVSVDLARRSLLANGLDGRCRVHHADLRRVAVAAGPFALVTGTPPYLPPAAARSSKDPQRRACRLETRGGIEDYCDAAARRLEPGGRFVCCMPGEPEGRVGEAARAAGLAIEFHRAVVPRAGKEPLFALWSFVRSPWTRPARRLSPLVVRDRRGVWTPDMRRVRNEMGMPGGFDGTTR